MRVRTKACSKRDWLVYLAILPLVVVSLYAAPVTAFELITAEEASRPKESFPLEFGGGMGRRPTIEMLAPKKMVHNPSPFELKIYFEAKNGAMIDPNSIEILYWTARRIDLTPRLIPFFKDNVISIARAIAPRGRHQIQVSVTDSNGIGQTRIYNLQVD